MSGSPHCSRAGMPLAAALLLLGCARAPVQMRDITHEGLAIPLDKPEQLLQHVATANDSYRTLSAVHKVALEIALGGERSEKRFFQAAVAVRRPGTFRLHILGPMGVTLVDLLYDKGKSRVLHIAEQLRRSSRLPAILDSIAEDIRAIYRLTPLPAVSHRKMEQTVSLASGTLPLYTLQEYLSDTVVCEMDVFASTFAVARAEVTDRQGGIRTITYGNYQTNGSLMIPRSIHLSKEGSTTYWLSIQVEAVTVDEKLDEHLFVVE